MSRYLVTVLILIWVQSACAQIHSEDIPQEWWDEPVVVRLVGGDKIYGILLGLIQHDSINAIKLRTSFGTATIDLEQVAEVCLVHDHYRHAYRLLLMPTAEPIRKNFSVMSLGLISIGTAFGIGDILSVTLLRTIVPSIPSAHQVSLINAKATILSTDYYYLDGHLSLALGTNLAWLNAPNQLGHLWAAATFTRVQSRVTVLTFYNVSPRDVYEVNAGTLGSVMVRYPSNALGFGVGLDVQIPSRDDLHVLAELWNHDLTRPYQSLVVLGVRLANSAVCLDAGVAIGSFPFIIPLAAVGWTPW